MASFSPFGLLLLLWVFVSYSSCRFGFLSSFLNPATTQPPSVWTVKTWRRSGLRLRRGKVRPRRRRRLRRDRDRSDTSSASAALLLHLCLQMSLVRLNKVSSSGLGPPVLPACPPVWRFSSGLKNPGTLETPGLSWWLAHHLGLVSCGKIVDLKAEQISVSTRKYFKIQS